LGVVLAFRGGMKVKNKIENGYEIQIATRLHVTQTTSAAKNLKN
jgi:hypothetical protein